MSVPGATELLAPPVDGRLFADVRRVRLGDVDRRGRLRLDATARILQDIATDDAADAGLDRRFGWLVRRTLLDVASPATLGETLDVATWCTGLGRSWAERRSSLVGDRGARVDAVSLWVQIEVATGRPARIGGDFTDAYGSAAGGRTVSARLSIPPLQADAPAGTRPWTVRRTDLDPFEHVNNAANWDFLEEVAALDAEESSRRGRAEMEYLQPVTHVMSPTVSTLVGPRGGVTAWLHDGDQALSAARWTPGDVVSGG